MNILLFLVAAAVGDEISGPWEHGSYLDIYVSAGAAHSVWVEGDKLRYTIVGGARVEDIASGVLAGEGGGVRPDLVVTGDGVAHVVYSTASGVQHATRKASGDWQRTTVSTGSAHGESMTAVTLDKAGSLVIVALVREGARSVLYANGALAYDGGTDGVCMCCKPAIATRSEGVVLAFRDADAKRRDIRWLRMTSALSWLDLGDATKGAWSPGGCPSDGPVLTETTLLVSDARDGKRRVYEVSASGERHLSPLDAAAEMVQPRALPDGSLVGWIEATPGKLNYVVRDGPGAPAVVATSNGRLEPGDPVAVGPEVWLPWQGEHAHLTSWKSQIPY